MNEFTMFKEQQGGQCDWGSEGQVRGRYEMTLGRSVEIPLYNVWEVYDKEFGFYTNPKRIPLMSFKQ